MRQDQKEYPLAVERPVPLEHPQVQVVLPQERKESTRSQGVLLPRRKGVPQASEKDAFSGVEIPAHVRDAAGFRSSHNDGGIYPEIDSYVLFGGEKHIEVNVPGTEVCIEGDQLRTKDRMTITDIKSDHSKCRIVEPGENVPLKEICPPDAHTRVVHINHHASSPLVYSIRTCLQYDTCRVDFRYEGMWAEGTLWAYNHQIGRTHVSPFTSI